MRCSRCGKEIPNDSVFCPECGAEQTTEEKTEENEKKIRCPKCGSEIPEDSVFCPECGNSVRENVLQKKIHPQKIIHKIFMIHCLLRDYKVPLISLRVLDHSFQAFLYALFLPVSYVHKP